MAKTLFTSHAASFAKGEESARSTLSQQLCTPIQFMDQVHGTDVVLIEEITETPTCDAIVTNKVGLALAVLVADCLPILIDGKNVVAAVHAGRKGLVDGVIEMTLEAMGDLSETPRSEYRVHIGPSICAECYEVSPEMYQALTDRYPALATSEERHALNLKAEAKARLESLGITAYLDSGVCTAESPSHFSYRGGDLTARQVGVISL